MQTRSYQDKNGNTRYVTEVVVDEAEVTGAKAEKTEPKVNKVNAAPVADPLDEFADWEPASDEQLPF